MKNFAIKLLIFLFLAFLLTLSFISCDTYQIATTSPPYEVKIKDNALFPKKAIKIGTSTYVTVHDSVYVSMVDGREFNCYEIFLASGEKAAEASKLRNTPTIVLEKETDELIFFSYITPFPAIPMVNTLSPEELQAMAEITLRSITDFDIYNCFSYTVRTGYDQPYYVLRWSEKRQDIGRARSLEIRIDSQGFIDYFKKTDSCPAELNADFISEKRQIALVEKAICKKLKILSMKNISYEIKERYLSLYQNKPVLTLYVHVTDARGFDHVFFFKIT